MKDNMQRLKDIEVDMLREFIMVCEKLDLTYYIMYGSLLGAVRHKGFIPWDDDIDVGMPRKDYEIFMQKAQGLLPSHLFVQNLHTDKNVPFAFGKIRNSNTTFIESSVKNLEMNHGVFIDIFPLDFFPESKKEQRRIIKKQIFYKQNISKIFTPKMHKFSQRIKHIVRKLVFLFFPYKRAVCKLDGLYKNVSKSNLIVDYNIYGITKVFTQEQYGKGVELTFEGLKVKAPTKYVECLTELYGDYMQLPPEEKRVAHHFNDVIDLDKSYLFYKKQ